MCERCHSGLDHAPLPPAVAAALDPGIRGLVAILRANGFATQDSGDGAHVEEKAALYGEDAVMPFPHVVMAVDPAALISEADRLLALIRSWGITLTGHEDGEGPSLEATYSPAAGKAFLALAEVTDAMLPVPVLALARLAEMDADLAEVDALLAQ